MDLKEAVLARVDLAQLAGQYTSLARAGREWRGRCPFHNEKTASFYVNAEKGVYHCYGCKASGTAISFVMAAENLDFKDALEWLAKRYGIEIEQHRQVGQPVGTKERLHAINEAAAEFFRHALAASQGEVARAYLDRREVDTRLRSEFDLGYAPKEWEALTNHLLASGFKAAEVVQLGLIKPRQQQSYSGQGGYHDAFRHRLMFPIRSATGRVIGFGGRALAEEDNPKYLNTPATPLYDKSSTLYNLDRAKSHTREEGLVIAEGYMDVIGLARAGIENVVASCGTALTEQHVRMAMRYSSRFFLCFDSDPAGRKAGWSAGAMFLRSGFDARIIDLDGAKDPDEWAKAQGTEAKSTWLRKVETSRSAVGVWLEHLALCEPSADTARRREWIIGLAGTYQSLPDDMVRADFVREVASAMRIGGQEAAGLLNATSVQTRAAGLHDQPQGHSTAVSKTAIRQQARQKALLQGTSPIEKEVMRRLLDDASFRSVFSASGDPDWFEQVAYRNACKALLSGQSPAAVQAESPEQLSQHFCALLMEQPLAESSADLLSRMRNLFLHRQIDTLQSEFDRAARDGDHIREREVLERVNALKRELRQITTLGTI